MYFVYILQSEEDGRFYVGMTGDVERRLKEHNRGKSKSTKGYRPWKLMKIEEFDKRSDARIREKYLKGGSGKELIKYWFHSSTG